MKTLLLSSLAATLVCAARPAAAAEPRENWYGWQILISDAVSFTVAGVGVAVFEDDGGARIAITTLSSLGYLFGGPIDHWAHGHAGKGFISLGLRLGVPLAAGAIGGGLAVLAAGHSGGDVDPFFIGFGIGAAVGIVSASLIDALVLGREPLDPAAVSLGVSAAPNHLSLGLLGRF